MSKAEGQVDDRAARGKESWGNRFGMGPLQVRRLGMSTSRQAG